jgi:hypothetical protein
MGHQISVPDPPAGGQKKKNLEGLGLVQVFTEFNYASREFASSFFCDSGPTKTVHGSWTCKTTIKQVCLGWITAMRWSHSCLQAWVELL